MAVVVVAGTVMDSPYFELEIGLSVVVAVVS